MWLVPVIEIEIIDKLKYKTNGSEKNDKFDELLSTLQISHKKSIINWKVVDVKIRWRKQQNSSNDVTGIKERDIIWHKMAIMDETNGKIGVDIIPFLNVRPMILSALESKILFVGVDNLIIEKINTITWNNRLINKHIFSILNEPFKLLQIKIWIHKIKIKIMPTIEVHEIDDKISNKGMIGSNIIAKKYGVTNRRFLCKS